MSYFLVKKKKPGKNPDVDTSFLPDKDREVSRLLARRESWDALRQKIDAYSGGEGNYS
jgi:protein FAM50